MTRKAVYIACWGWAASTMVEMGCETSDEANEEPLVMTRFIAWVTTQQEWGTTDSRLAGCFVGFVQGWKAALEVP